MAIYKLNQYLEDIGMTREKFNSLNKKTQQKIRDEHQKELQKKIIEHDEHVFRYTFLPMKHVNPEKFDELADWKKEEWRKQYEDWKAYEHRMRSMANQKRELTEWDLLGGMVPFGPDGPLGIG